jgi:glutamine synthetase type III
VLVLTANECLPLLISLFFTKSLVTALEDVLAASVFRKRQTTAQSSVFDVGYRVLHALWADSTRNRAAEACEGALLMMLTASALESTSHTYSQQRELVLNNFQFYKYKATNV